jgi:hypothetical protein
MSWRKASVGIYRATDGGRQAYFKDKEGIQNSTADLVVRAEQVTISLGTFLCPSRQQKTMEVSLALSPN